MFKGPVSPVGSLGSADATSVGKSVDGSDFNAARVSGAAKSAGRPPAVRAIRSPMQATALSARHIQIATASASEADSLEEYFKGVRSPEVASSLLALLAKARAELAQ